MHPKEVAMATKLYVGNLSYNVTQADLEGLFTQVGTVESVNVITDKFSGRSRGFGFVEMASNEEAQAAIKRFDGYDLKGRALKVNEARPQGERSDEGRPRSGGGGYRRGGRERRL
jgi:RNA recognition motif-containing protein